MNKEALCAHFQHFIKSTKDFIVKIYNNLAEYLQRKKMERKTTGRNIVLGMRCVKYILVLLSLFYLMLSLLMIFGGVFGQLAYVYGLVFELNMISIFWIATGAVLSFISVFGLIGAFKESTVWANMYGVFLIIAFVLQISSAIAVFSLTNNNVGHEIIDMLMMRYEYHHEALQTLDWIQTTFKCCGNDDPSDWDKYPVYGTRTFNGWYISDFIKLGYTLPPPTEPPIIPRKYQTPISCCVDVKNYENLTCDKYYQTGCAFEIRETVSESVLIIGCAALTIAVVQIIGIVTSFLFARLLRQTKSYRNVTKWDAPWLSGTAFNTPTNVDYTLLRQELVH